MGNTPSSPPKHSAGQSLSHAHQKESDKLHHDTQPRKEFRRRESAHALPTTTPKATPAPPSASLTSAVAQPASTSSSPSAPRSISKSSTDSRKRSATSGATHHLPPHERAMGNDNSKQQRELSRSSSVRASESSPATKPSSAILTQAVDVPGSQRSDDQSLGANLPPVDTHVIAPSSFSRPPRLPLAIEEEDHAPGSPILSPTGEFEERLEQEQDEGRRGSVISSTVDEEEEPDEFQGYMPDIDANGPKVPTIIEWRNAAINDKVYVTGTFTDWQRKFRLHWNGPSKKPQTVSAVIQLPPGTHHIKFLVNNEMVCSDHLPTTVDFTNILVNYIEVASDNASAAPKTTAAVAVPAPTPAPARPMDIRPKQAAPSSASSPARPSSPPTKPQLPASSSPTPARASPKPVTAPAVHHQDPRPVPSPTSAKPKVPIPPKHYTSQIPEYLLDLDSWPQSNDTHSQSPDPSSVTSRFQRANNAVQSLPAPPSLPLFLNKSILNGATPMKDDSSVLLFPNHTVLNHLATTNIKQGVLATSATTRYKKKFLTTIMYKPRSEDGD